MQILKQSINKMIQARADRMLVEDLSECEKCRYFQGYDSDDVDVGVGRVRIVENTEENRLRVFFDGKPAAEVITLLKQHGFKWSPRFKAWQRILTPNAKFALNQYVLPKLKESK